MQITLPSNRPDMCAPLFLSRSLPPHAWAGYTADMFPMLHLLTWLACGSPGLTELAEPQDTSVDTRTDTALGDDTGGTSTGQGTAPELSVFGVTEEEGRLRFAFQVKDVDDDLDGGSVEIKVPPRTENYVWGSSDMSVSNGTISIYWDAATITPDADLDALLSVTDAAGNLWVACWGGNCVICLDPEAREVSRIALPVRQPSCPAIGGPDLRDLYVTSATPGLSDGALRQYPLNGMTFVARDVAQGLPEPLVIL